MSIYSLFLNTKKTENITCYEEQEREDCSQWKKNSDI